MSANTNGEGANLLFWHFFPDNCMQLKKQGRVPRAAPLGSTKGYSKR